jgi:hypothetical protein
MKFLDWCKKEGNKNIRISKMVVFLLKVISAFLNTFIELFKTFLKTATKSLQRNSAQFGHCVSLNVFNILKPLSLRAVSH